MNFIVFLFLIFIVLLIFKNNSNHFTNNINKELFNDTDINIYVINLVKNKERLDNFIYEYNKSDLKNIPLTVFPAVIGKNLDLVKYVTPNAYKQILETEITNTRKYHYQLTRGGVGCYLSHITLWKQIAESNKKYGLIFEDDVVIATDFYSRLQDGLKKVPDDWDIYMCGVMCLKCDISSDYINVKRFWGTHGYLVKKETAVKLYNYLNKLIGKQIDADLSLLVKAGKIKIYAINPLIVAQSGNVSEIQTLIQNTEDDPFKEEFDQRNLIKN
jgi:glycosyl transferase family 25